MAKEQTTKEGILAEFPAIRGYRFEIHGTTKEAYLYLIDIREEKDLPPSGARMNTLLYIGPMKEIKAYAWGVTWGAMNAHILGGKHGL